MIESFAVEGYRSGRISAFTVSQLLGHGSRWETQDFLAEHDAWPGQTVAEFDCEFSGLALPGLLHLDPGERAAIQTAHSLGARIVQMDEKSGQLAVETLGLVAVGVIGILTTAARQGMIDFELVIRRLVETTNFRLSDAVLERARAALTKPAGGT
jgi:hypothetical protein